MEGVYTHDPIAGAKTGASLRLTTIR